LQAGSLPEPAGHRTPPGRAAAVRVYAVRGAPPFNRAVAAVEVGGGIPPRAGERSTVAVTVSASGAASPPGGTAGFETAASDSAGLSEPVPVRLVIDGVVEAAGRVAPGATAVLPFPARPAGTVTGHVEIDPDAFHADDRRYFVADVVPPTTLAVAAPRRFLEEAVAVLESSAQVRRTHTAEADVVLAPAATGVGAVRRGAAVVVLAPDSSVALGAANHRLARAGIPWRYQAPRPGEARLDTTVPGLGPALGEVRLRQVYGLRSLGDADSVLLRLRTGEPWAVTGRSGDGGGYVLLASPLTIEGGTIPVSAAMIPLLDRILRDWAAPRAASRTLVPGEILETGALLAPGAEAVAGPLYRVTEPGIYRVLEGGDTVEHAVNLPAAESCFERLDEAELRDRLAGREVAVASAADWASAIYHQRLGREVAGWLVLAALLLLALEMAVAGTGSRTRPTRVVMESPDVVRSGR
ncbi:MAG: hypothetical protein ACLFRX_03935, partial [Gemmatimonadota bacterium]